LFLYGLRIVPTSPVCKPDPPGVQETMSAQSPGRHTADSGLVVAGIVGRNEIDVNGALQPL
jgi:hypothetical protein